MARRKTPEERLWMRIEELGLEPLAVAERANVDLIWVEELESEENLEAWTVKDVKRVVDVLEMDPLDLFGVKCAYCGKGVDDGEELGILPRNELIRRRREELGLSKEDLLAKAGLTEWFVRVGDTEWTRTYMNEYGGIEDSPDAIDELDFWDVKRENKVLKLPLQLLLGVKCPKCGR